MWRKVLATTVATSALCVGLAHAQNPNDEEPRFEPRFGDILAFQGDFFAFGGDILAFERDILAFGGDYTPNQGDILAFGRDFHPFHGDYTPFYGYTSPLWGDIEPFWGRDIQPFHGDITAFWGDILAFEGDILAFGGDILAFNNPTAALGAIGDFWAATGPAWGDIFSKWDELRADPNTTKAQWEALERELDKIIEDANALFGAAATEATGHGVSKWNGFLKDLLDKHGIDLRREENMANASSTDLSAFFLDFYDGLMAFSGFDAVDHWMPMINWTPALTQDSSFGGQVKVGLIDARIKDREGELDFLTTIGGHEGKPMDHGAAVASLIAARHDGEGVMGIAPMADVYAYNPFDGTGTASASDVAAGIRALAAEGVSVINMSLGVPGYAFHQDIADTLSMADLNGVANDIVIVTAAGNEGVAQTGDVVWGNEGISHNNLLIVGSVGMTGQISSFSNRPGDACFTDAAGHCGAGDMLMDRFLVAPGEMLLTTDNNGGTMRVSGTSFAAPLVTGTVALMQDFWPWLENDARAVTEIILNTAQDLGAPGVDEVYGHGLLDVEAALSPISFDQLAIYFDNGNGSLRHKTSTWLASAAVDPGRLGLWEANGASIYAFEDVYGTFRDFEIPLSTLLHGQVGIYEHYQRHVQRRMLDWAADTNANQGFASTQTLAGTEDWSLTFTDDVTTPTGGMLTFRSEEQGLTVIAGLGNGLHGLSSVSTFDRARDYDANRGGANPMLGLASGGSFGSLSKDFANNLTLTVGYSGTALQQLEMDPLTGLETDGNIMFGRREAVAATAEVAYQATEKLRIGAALSGLSEEDSALGSASAGALSMNEDAVTSGLTMTATYALSPTITLAASATGAHTFATDTSEGGLGVGAQGLQSSAFQVNADFRSLMKKGDRFTLSAIQPLRVESGGMAFTQLQVTDRSTGETGVVTNNWGLGGGPRQLAFEADYSIALNDGQMQLGAFSRYDLNDIDIDGRFNAVTVGARFGASF